MSRYINREDLLKNLKQFAPEYLKPLIVSLIEKQPTADVAEVVRCKDCKHYKPYVKPVEDFDGECIVRESETDEDEFCEVVAKAIEDGDISRIDGETVMNAASVQLKVNLDGNQNTLPALLFWRVFF